ncbi:hydrogen peroxide-dependent heme synthase [Microbacterium sp. MC2]
MSDQNALEDNPVGFALFAILSGPRPRTAAPTPEALTALSDEIVALADAGVTLRGLYDVTGMRADADLMVWLHLAPGDDDAAALQKALRTLRRTEALREFTCIWSAMGVHREAEFNKRHIPGFMRGERARDWLCLYPFVRSHEWYLLPDEERAHMLATHGRKGATYSDVVANTISAFALNDYEWLLPMESDNLVSIVDLMRGLRATDARRHVREEVPFHTGRRIEVAELAEVLG